MAKNDEAVEVQSQFGTRISKELHRRLRLYCVTEDVSMTEFVTDAIREKLARKSRGELEK
jgi:predicted HicB family RNase H-like nuclease